MIFFQIPECATNHWSKQCCPRKRKRTSSQGWQVGPNQMILFGSTTCRLTVDLDVICVDFSRIFELEASISKLQGTNKELLQELEKYKAANTVSTFRTFPFPVSWVVCCLNLCVSILPGIARWAECLEHGIRVPGGEVPKGSGGQQWAGLTLDEPQGHGCRQAQRGEWQDYASQTQSVEEGTWGGFERVQRGTPLEYYAPIDHSGCTLSWHYSLRCMKAPWLEIMVLLPLFAHMFLYQGEPCIHLWVQASFLEREMLLHTRICIFLSSPFLVRMLMMVKWMPSDGVPQVVSLPLEDQIASSNCGKLSMVCNSLLETHISAVKPQWDCCFINALFVTLTSWE